MITEFKHEEMKDKMGKELYEIVQDLRKPAIESRDKCRFIKSTTKVGCAILTSNNEITWGCNFDYEWGIANHAEDSAICNMINICKEDSLIRAIYLYIEDRKNFTPCGNCRDKIYYFAEDKERMLLYLDNGKTIRVFSLGELTPDFPER